MFNDDWHGEKKQFTTGQLLTSILVNLILLLACLLMYRAATKVENHSQLPVLGELLH